MVRAVKRFLNRQCFLQYLPGVLRIWKYFVCVSASAAYAGRYKWNGTQIQQTRIHNLFDRRYLCSRLAIGWICEQDNGTASDASI